MGHRLLLVMTFRFKYAHQLKPKNAVLQMDMHIFFILHMLNKNRRKIFNSC